MPICPECDNPLDFDEDDVEEGDTVICEECGAEYEIVAIDPIEMVRIEEDYDDDGRGYSSTEEDE